MGHALGAAQEKRGAASCTMPSARGGKKKKKKKKGIYDKTVRQLIISPPILRPGLLPLLYMLHAPGTTAVAAQQYRYVVPVRDWVEYKYMMLCS